MGAVWGELGQNQAGFTVWQDGANGLQVSF